MRVSYDDAGDGVGLMPYGVRVYHPLHEQIQYAADECSDRRKLFQECLSQFSNMVQLPRDKETAFMAMEYMIDHCGSNRRDLAKVTLRILDELPHLLEKNTPRTAEAFEAIAKSLGRDINILNNIAGRMPDGTSVYMKTCSLKDFPSPLINFAVQSPNISRKHHIQMFPFDVSQDAQIPCSGSSDVARYACDFVRSAGDALASDDLPDFRMRLLTRLKLPLLFLGPSSVDPFVNSEARIPSWQALAHTLAAKRRVPKRPAVNAAPSLTAEPVPVV